MPVAIPSTLVHGVRSASIGLMDAARNAGTKPAKSAEIASVSPPQARREFPPAVPTQSAPWAMRITL